MAEFEAVGFVVPQAATSPTTRAAPRKADRRMRFIGSPLSNVEIGLRQSRSRVDGYAGTVGWAVKMETCAFSGTMTPRIFCRASTWTQDPQLSKKWQVHCQAPPSRRTVWVSLSPLNVTASCSDLIRSSSRE